jgi:hypothetical protein
MRTLEDALIETFIMYDHVNTLLKHIVTVRTRRGQDQYIVQIEVVKEICEKEGFSIDIVGNTLYITIDLSKVT